MFDPNGAVQAFVGASERMATTTSYRVFSKDRDVFYDGYGPQRDYTVTIPGGSGNFTSFGAVSVFLVCRM